MIRVVKTFYAIRIYFGEVLHAHIPLKDYRGMQAWMDSESKCSIEFALTGGNLVVEYDDRKKWISVLNQLDGLL